MTAPNPLVSHLAALTERPFIPELHADDCDDVSCVACRERTSAPIERLDVPVADVLADLARIREALPLDDPDRHALDLDADTAFARLAANWSTT